jgi:cysteine synthase
MKYRFTLLKTGQDLTLTACEWDGQTGAGEVLASLILEDFTTPAYFFESVVFRFDDAATHETGDVLKLVWPYSESVQDRVLSDLNALASPYRYGPVGCGYADLIGKTPLLKLGRLAEDCGATVLVKLECMEPGSVKDRPVLSMIEQAVERGDIKDDVEVVEASSCNVAFALSAVMGALLDRKPKIFISKMHGAPKRRAVRASGVPIVLTPKEQGSYGAKLASIQYAEEKGEVFQVNQHGNPDNPRAHRIATGPELYHQCHVMTGQPPTEFVTGLGSGGTAIGVCWFRNDIGATFKVVGVEPEEATLLTGGDFNAHRFSGIAPGFITPIVERDRDQIDVVETATAEEGFEICRRMLVEEGLLIGASSGASIAVALRRARLPENEGKVIVTIAHDRGDRYLEIDDLFVPPPGATEEDLAEGETE